MKLHQPVRTSVLVLFLLLLSSWPAASRAQTFDDNVLPQRVPKTPDKPAAASPEPSVPPAKAPEAANPEDAQPLPFDALKGIVLFKTREEFKETGIASVSGLQVLDIPLLSGPDFKKVAQPYLGRKVTKGDIKKLESDIILYCRSKNHPFVDVILPQQDCTAGVIQLWFLEGRIGKITVENQGHKWFPDKLVRDQVRLRPGETVDTEKLNADLDWVNRNPFRQVSTVFKPGDKLGDTDLQLRVEDRFPVRVYGGYENSGTQFTGEDRLLAGFNWGNVFGLDQQLNYQYTTDIDFKSISAHSASYLIPLPWRHNLSLLGAYANTTAEFPNTSEGKGKSYQASARYSIPLRVSKNYMQEITAGFDFKRLNNDFEFGGVTESTRNVDVDQFQLGYSGLLVDRWGQTSFGLEGYYSPGSLTADNTDQAYNDLRPDSKANYLYGRFTAERLTVLPYDVTYVIHFFGQLANERLTPSEQIGIGGFGTVRGYGERFVNGDNGWVLNNELRSPPVRLGKLLPSLHYDDKLQFLAFFDYGSVSIKDLNASDVSLGLEQETSLSSVGAGLRYTVHNNLSVRFDYGFQLMNKEPGKHSGSHVGVLLSF
jgi:hemolysin activation/secretion protein